MPSAMRLIIILFVTLGDCPAVVDGPSGNRVTGVVYERGSGDATTPSPNAAVCILSRDKCDETNQDGVCYIVLSSDIDKFDLVAKKHDFQSAQSRTTYTNQKDPVKAERLTLEPEDPKSPNFRQIVDREIAILQSVASPQLKKLIVGDLMNLSQRARTGDAAYIKEKLARLALFP